MGRIAEMVRDLLPYLQQEVEDFVQFLLEKRSKGPRGKPTFDWAGALRDHRDQYTALELQKKALEWRDD